MARTRHRRPSLIATLVAQEYSRLLRRRTVLPRRSRHRTSAPGPLLPQTPAHRRFTSAELAYCARFPTRPPWLDPQDLVMDVDPSRLACMADAEDGEQPWHPSTHLLSDHPDP